jgi:hypothetical protein
MLSAHAQRVLLAAQSCLVAFAYIVATENIGQHCARNCHVTRDLGRGRENKTLKYEDYREDGECQICLSDDVYWLMGTDHSLVAAAFPKKFRVTDDTNPDCGMLPLPLVLFTVASTYCGILLNFFQQASIDFWTSILYPARRDATLRTLNIYDILSVDHVRDLCTVHPSRLF